MTMKDQVSKLREKLVQLRIENDGINETIE
jgi:hypothetical protein